MEKRRSGANHAPPPWPVCLLAAALTGVFVPTAERKARWSLWATACLPSRPSGDLVLYADAVKDGSTAGA